MNRTNWMQDLGDQVRHHRKLADLTQKELAQLAGVGKTVVFDLEKGKTTIQMATVLKILACLNIDLVWHLPTSGPGPGYPDEPTGGGHHA